MEAMAEFHSALADASGNTALSAFWFAVRRVVEVPEAAVHHSLDSIEGALRAHRRIAEAIRKHNVLDQLPGWTEADVYVEATRRWLAMSAMGEPAGPDPAIEALLREHHRTWWQRRRRIQLPERRVEDRREK